MTQEVASKLNQINKSFYSEIAQSFSDTRSYNWEGWDILWKEIKEEKISIRNVLDLGCGNGRFLKFLEEKGWSGEYIGVDFDSQLLSIAKNLDSGSEVKFVSHDIVMDLESLDLEDEFDLIVCFGVMHHIPSRSKRSEVVQFVEKHLSPKGISALAFWMFNEDSRFTSRNVEWKEVGISMDEVGDEDYLLDWRKGSVAYRYCHHYSDEEILSILNETKLSLSKKYRADGRSHRLNKYILLKK